jgi:hypothetical protein
MLQRGLTTSTRRYDIQLRGLKDILQRVGESNSDRRTRATPSRIRASRIISTVILSSQLPALPVSQPQDRSLAFVLDFSLAYLLHHTSLGIMILLRSYTANLNVHLWDGNGQESS